MEWTWTKNARAAEAFLKIDQVIALVRATQHWNTYSEMPQGVRPLMTEMQLDAVLQLAVSLAEDVQRLMRQTLPDPDAWEMREIHRVMARPEPVQEVLG